MGSRMILGRMTKIARHNRVSFVGGSTDTARFVHPEKIPSCLLDVVPEDGPRNIKAKHEARTLQEKKST